MVLRPRRVASAIFTALLFSSSIAAAHDDPGREGAGKPIGESTDKDEGEPQWEATLDLDIGATTSTVLTSGPSNRNYSLPPTNTFDSTRVSVGSLIVGVERKIGERFIVGARLPLIYAELTSRDAGADDRSATAIGNLELEGAFHIIKRENFELTFALEVALPTSGGDENASSATVAANPTNKFDYDSYDAFAAVHGASAARGSYESALFEPNNLGIVPKLTAHFQLGRLGITPMVKVENLVDVKGEAEEKYIIEVVAGVRAGYRVSKWLEPGVNLWLRELHEHDQGTNDNGGVGVVEPYFRFHAGAFTPAVSAIIPFAGDLTDDKTWGLRATVALEF